jgi:hypothetical protein
MGIGRCPAVPKEVVRLGDRVWRPYAVALRLGGKLDDVTDGGVVISQEECDRRWRPWSLQTLAERLGGVKHWAVVGGWAIDLYLGRVTRDHRDLEIAIPAQSFEEIAAVVPELAWDVVGDGKLWPYPERLGESHQTWLRDPASGSFLLDVFREPGDDTAWVYRRDRTITVPVAEAFLQSEDGLRYLAPELVLLFKAKHQRLKDQQDFDAVAPTLNTRQRARLRTLLGRTEPAHSWLDLL